jgi:hypothetical protein
VSDLLGGYYGNAGANVPRAAPAAPMSADDDEGWVLPRRPRPGSCTPPNAYARGNVDLENRFGAMPSSPRRTSAPGSGLALSLELERRREFSRPFYDTGEHVLLGDVNAGSLHVGQKPGVEFSYGQLVAMGDLYQDVEQMMKASVAELTRLKTMIASDTSFYSGKKVNKALGIANKDWDDATSGRFLKLAEENYEHFSPAHVAMATTNGVSHGNNQSEWQKYHQHAIEAAQAMWLASNGRVSIFYEWPLTINAFGDHFLTDAFAAGHLINKDIMLNLFDSNFYGGKASLNSDGEDFFKRVAQAAWWGYVESKFSKLEMKDTKGVIFHPTINSADRFGSLLITIANRSAQRTRVGNLMVKCLHDRLNADGVEVTNQAGDGTWFLPGDGSLMVGKGRLTPQNLTTNFSIIRKAVQQSINDVTDPPKTSITDFSPYFDGVWRYCPILTSAGQKEITALIKEYTDPHSKTLVNAAADIIHEQLETLLKLITDDPHGLRPETPSVVPAVVGGAAGLLLLLL